MIVIRILPAAGPTRARADIERHTDMTAKEFANRESVPGTILAALI
jgi:hypothetical protein